jgi:hypothetical protein
VTPIKTLLRLALEAGYDVRALTRGWKPPEDEIAWVDDNLEGFKGRVTRDDWVAQARILAAGGTTEFSDRVDKGDVY